MCGLVLRDARFGEDAVHLLPGHPPRIEVRNHEGAAGGEQAFEHLRSLRKGIDTDHQRFGVGRALKGALYFIHNSNCVNETSPEIPECS